MSPTPETRLLDPRDVLRALALLTRLPVPGADGDRTAASAWAWPFVGLIVGGLSGALAMAALLLGLPPPIAAGLALGAGIVITGALHEDGLADCADGFWGGHDAARRLEIMKDSRIGAYGVIAMILVIGLKWLALSALLDAGALWIAVLLPAVLEPGCDGRDNGHPPLRARGWVRPPCRSPVKSGRRNSHRGIGAAERRDGGQRGGHGGRRRHRCQCRIGATGAR
jgi:hypothetical protein